MYYILDENREPVRVPNVLEWGAWHSTRGSTLTYNARGERVAPWIVAHTIVAPGVEVSTVFLGINHGFAISDGAPVLWETLITGTEHDGVIERYISRREAKLGHLRWVDRLLRDTNL